VSQGRAGTDAGHGTGRGDALRRAEADGAEIAELVASLPDRERKQLRELNDTAKALVDRVRGLFVALREIERAGPAGSPATLDREIARLEAQANPLDREASESRVRRLASLKRDRRGAAERARRREQLEGKLESCVLALQNLRFDVLRLKTGSSSTASVTQLAEQAMSLARDVDGMIEVNASARRTPPESKR
jgi:serine/threonine-protein kinase